MREILFRGKRKGCGDWVYGFLTMREFKALAIFVPSQKERLEYAEPFGVTYCVYPATVGQFTGLTDKNGKKIFEGDIIKHYNDKNFPERFEVGMVWWDDCHLCFKRTSNSKSVFVWRKCTYEVIGNVHDNPELLKGGVGNGWSDLPKGVN